MVIRGQGVGIHIFPSFFLRVLDLKNGQNLLVFASIELLLK